MTALPDKSWADRITRLMDAADLTVDALVKALKVNRSTVYSWRAGTRRPRREIQPRLARKLGATVAELNGWSE